LTFLQNCGWGKDHDGTFETSAGIWETVSQTQSTDGEISPLPSQRRQWQSSTLRPDADSVVNPGVSDFDMILVDVDDVASEREMLDEVSLTL
jgi:hypothetical protein